MCFRKRLTTKPLWFSAVVYEPKARPTWIRTLAARWHWFLLAITFLSVVNGVAAQSAAIPPRQFPPGSLNRISDLPTGRFRGDLEQLPPTAQSRALAWLRGFHFTERDLDSLQVDPEGGVFYADQFTIEPPATAQTEPVVASAALPVSPLPASLIFHSKPGSPNTLFLNFSGDTITGTAWNTSLNSVSIPAVAFSTDADYTTFSDAEQTAIKRIWERVSEDYAPFDIDVTTERPATFTIRTAHALITRNTDANGAANPSSSAGGVAYINVFNTSSYANYRPGWIYFNNLANDESYIAEAVSHEMGHNMGLSHDATGTTSYYGGHGSGNISWGPIMGTGYNENVTQWSKGEYYQANNTEDDLAIVAGKLSYRPDDHGNNYLSATPLVITAGTNILSTTPETDPAKTNTFNKGILQSNTDVDVFSFVTGNGPIKITVNPWIMPAGTRGGNLDVSLELRDANGTLLLTNNPPTDTVAQIQTNLTDGQYYLYVKNSGAGDPFSSSPTGYTSYGSIGQYFISGQVVPSGFVVPPIANLQITNINTANVASQLFTVVYSDAVGIDISTFDNDDVRVTGPNGYDVSAQFIGIDVASDGTPRTAAYIAIPPDGIAWTPNDDGTYTVSMRSNAVFNLPGAAVPSGTLGQFSISIPVVVYSELLNQDPGWNLQPLWQYGQPTYAIGGPTSGFTGTKIIAYNLAGNYEDSLATKYATTPPINCEGVFNLTLKFQRWLRLKNMDNARVEISTNGSTWVSIWSTSQPVSDTSWQLMQYALPSWASGSSTLQVRWGLSSGQSQNEIGWNLDDIELTGTPDNVPAVFQLTTAANNPAWGSVSPGGTYPSGSAIQLLASPTLYYQFDGWTGDAAGTNNPLSLVLDSNLSIQAIFSEQLTTNFSTPLSWLAAHGYTNDFESVVTNSGANQIPLWQSYIAGLDPADPASQFKVALTAGPGSTQILQWNTVTGRVYTVWTSTNALLDFAPVPGAVSLPPTIQYFTNTVPAETPAQFYRIQVQKP